MRIGIVEDDDLYAEFLQEELKGEFPEATIHRVDHPFGAKAFCRPEFIVYDLGSIGSTMGGAHAVMSPVLSLGELFPGAIFIIVSALDWLVHETIEEIRQENPDLVIESGAGNDRIEGIAKAIRKHSAERSAV